jgi:hypothetical protein
MNSQSLHESRGALLLGSNALPLQEEDVDVI